MEDYVCFCGRECNDERSLHEHQHLVHPSRVPLSCEICQRNFKRADYLLKHRKNGCPLLRSPKATPTKSSRAHKYTCRQCGTAFARKYLLASHAQTCERGETVLCPFCPFETRVGQLAKHLNCCDGALRAVREGPYPIDAENDKLCFCGELFATADQLREHKRDVHRSAVPLFCMYCKAQQQSLSEARRHMLHRCSLGRKARLLEAELMAGGQRPDSPDSDAPETP